jgi:tetratricopeptide (TPR) repeat protein
MAMRVSLTQSLAIVATALLCGCAARGDATGRAPRPRATGELSPETRVSASALSDYMAKVRHLSANAQAAPTSSVRETLEIRDADLAADLLRLSQAPAAATHRAVAERYRVRGVLDAAYRHYNAAVKLDARDAAGYEGLARVWRDWGLPQLALGDAHRAVFFAPASAAAHNTLGTVMQALGRHEDARAAYELATALDAQASYAFNNLCYLSFLDGGTEGAIVACRRALSLDPTLTAARNNLALAYAASGRMDLAQTEFIDANDAGRGLYNVGITHLASGNYAAAVAAFDAASRANPLLAIARERASQIRSQLQATRTGYAGPQEP